MVDPDDVDIADADFLSDIGEDLLVDDDSDSDIDSYCRQFTCKNRLFGRQKPLHLVLGRGRCADIILWRNKEISACILAGATVTWLLFEQIGYHLLTFVCHFLLLVMVPLFLWSTLASYTQISPPEVPEIIIPHDLFLAVALQLRIEYNGALRILGDASFGSDSKKFLKVIASLWSISVLCSWFSLLTLVYLATVTVLVVPVLYEKYEDTVDTFAEKALIEVKIQYKLLNEKVIQKLPKVIKMSHRNKKLE